MLFILSFKMPVQALGKPPEVARNEMKEQVSRRKKCMRKQLENVVIWISPCELDTNQNSANSHVNYDIINIPRKYFSRSRMRFY